MHDTEERSVRRSPRSARPAHSDLPPAGDAGSAVLERTAGLLSAALLAAQDGNQGAAVLRVVGEIDFESSPLLRELTMAVLERGTCPLVVDLSAVSFMDASGVHFLLDTRQRLQDQSRRLAIVCRGRGHVHRLLGLVGMVDAPLVHRSRESALTDGDDLIRSEPCTYVTQSDGLAL